MHKLYIVPVIFFLISFVFSMLGMGGSQLYIPILYWFGMNFKHEAIPLGLLLNIFTSASAAFTYYRHKFINMRLAFPFAFSMVVFAPVGSYFNFQVPVYIVILVFALFTFISSILVYTGWKPKRRIETKRAEVILGITAGSLLGFVTGFTGRGGGAMVVPILLMSGLEPKVAAATSSFIVTMSATSGFIGHLPRAHFYPLVTVGCILAVLCGSQLGSRFMAQKLKPQEVRYIFATILLFVAIWLFKDAIILWGKG